ncbi:unnamed protein product [Diatraea saccharalis]|uniref:Uncharacterized protein n=1 Tax=Diatraea saccharalis TaxID=40085 RepID=A0A9N9RGP6_9NEOP|nr:unnamed protein product [Diatraea saccharalis]
MNSLESRKRKADSISRVQSKMLRVDAEHYYDAGQISTSSENNRPILEETMVADKYYEIDNNVATNLQHPSGDFLQYSANSSEVIDDTDEEYYSENLNTFFNIGQKSKVNIKRNEKVSKRELKKYLRSVKFDQNSVVSTNNSIILLSSPLTCQNRKAQQFNSQATPVDEVHIVDDIQDMPSDVVFASAPEIKKTAQTASVDEILTADVVQDMLSDAVFAPAPEKEKISQTIPIDEVLTADFVQGVPSDVVFAPAPKIEKFSQNTPVAEVLTADVVQGVPSDVVFALAPEIEKFSQNTPVAEVLTADVVQGVPSDVVFTPAPEIEKIAQTSPVDEVLTADVVQGVPSDVVFAPTPEIEKIAQTSPVDEVLTADVVQGVPSDVVFSPAPEIEKTAQTTPSDVISIQKGSPSIITFDTSFFDSITDTSDLDMNSKQSIRSKKFRNKILKSYVDYLSDNEDFSAGSSDL